MEEMYQERNGIYICNICRKNVGDMKRVKLHDQDKKHKMRLAYAAEVIKEKRQRSSSSAENQPQTPSFSNSSSQENLASPSLVSPSEDKWEKLANVLEAAVDSTQQNEQYCWYIPRECTQPWDAIGEELSEFYKFLAPTDASQLTVELTLARICSLVEGAWGRPKEDVLAEVLKTRNCQLGDNPWAIAIPIGTCMYGMRLPESYLELTVLTNRLSEDYDEEDIINKLMGLISYNDICTDVLKSRTGWKPCLTGTDRRTKLRIQMTVNNLDGLYLSAFTRKLFWSNEYLAPRIIFMCMKYVLYSRGLLPATSKGLEDLPLAFQVFTFFQQHQRFCKISNEIKNSRKLLGVLLFDFVEIFGKSFSHETMGIFFDKSSGFRIGKKSRPSSELFIRSPFSAENMANLNGNLEDFQSTCHDIRKNFEEYKTFNALVGKRETPLCSFLLMQKKTAEMRQKLHSIAVNIATSSYEFQHKTFDPCNAESVVGYENIRSGRDMKCIKRLRELTEAVFEALGDSDLLNVDAYLTTLEGNYSVER